ncbi:MAG: sugar transferase [Anaerolineales bacterium]|nr:sugar transferase [Anaerolineales bacterium]
MFRRYSANHIILSILIDSIFVVLSLYSAAHLRPIFNEMKVVKEIADPVELQLGIYLISIVVWIGIFYYSSVYDIRNNERFFQEFSNLVFASSLGALILAGIMYLTYRNVSRLLFLLFVAQLIISTISWRLVPWVLIRLKLNGENSRSFLIVGTGKTGKDLRDRIVENPQLNLTFAGFVSDDNKSNEKIQDVITPLKELREAIVSKKIQDVFITLPREKFADVDSLVQLLYDIPVTIWVIPDYFSLVLQRAEVEEFAGIPLLNLRAPALKEHQVLVKRIFDLILAVLVAPFSLAVMAVISLILKIEGKGSVLFVQERVGQNGCLFNMYKFRTMTIGADLKYAGIGDVDEVDIMRHKLPDDPRITKVGKLLRKSSLDELPQLFNVFLGNMSFVGPRPELPWVVAGYEKWQHKRFSISPGITGWWQIMGRSDRPMHLHTEDDLYYIRNYSILLDIRILLITIGKVVKGEGAY